MNYPQKFPISTIFHRASPKFTTKNTEKNDDFCENSSVGKMSILARGKKSRFHEKMKSKIFEKRHFEFRKNRCSIWNLFHRAKIDFLKIYYNFPKISISNLWFLGSLNINEKYASLLGFQKSIDDQDLWNTSYYSICKNQ